jgi:hypothetical protein
LTTPVVRLPLLEEVARKFVKIERLLQPSTSRTGTYAPIDLLQLACAGRCSIWFVEHAGRLDAVLVTVLQQYPRRRVLELLFGGGGDLQQWLPAADRVLEAHARQLGCDAVVTIGRPGWARATGGHPTGDVVIERKVAGV